MAVKFSANVSKPSGNLNKENNMLIVATVEINV